MAGSVEFHTGVPDVEAFACRLLRKAYRHGATVLCLAPPAPLEALDRALWTFAEREFVPHVRLGAAPIGLLRATPIWLATAWSPEGPQGGAPAREVVLNLGVDLPFGETGTARLIEVVGDEAGEVERGRARWRACKAAGCEVVHHPFGADPAGREA